MRLYKEYEVRELIAAAVRRASGAAMKSKIIYNRYSVDVYNEADEFMGGITERRMVGPELVAEALACILKAYGQTVTVEHDPAAPDAPPTQETP